MPLATSCRALSGRRVVLRRPAASSTAVTPISSSAWPANSALTPDKRRWSPTSSAPPPSDAAWALNFSADFEARGRV